MTIGQQKNTTDGTPRASFGRGRRASQCANPEARDTGGGRRIGDGAGAVALKA